MAILKRVDIERLADLNQGFIQERLADYLNAPESVPPEWRELFESSPEFLVEQLPGLERLRDAGLLGNGANGAAAAVPAPPAPPEAKAPSAEPAVSETLLGGVAAGTALVKAHRMHGHLAAQLDPLGSEPVGDPALDPDRLEPRLTEELQRQVPTRVLRVYVPGETLADALPDLKEIYTGTIAYEIEHISSHVQRVWLRRAIESSTYRKALKKKERKRLLERLSEVEGFERFLRRAFLGQKQFSIEGLDVMIPMLDEALELAASTGAREVHVGMAHRGRLNVLAHTVGIPIEAILREFEGERVVEAIGSDSEGGTGDVKYHHGSTGFHDTTSGQLKVVLASNPSHLEFVDPVVEGSTRAVQTEHLTPEGTHDPKSALAILIHGDAAFPGQGVVAETLNLSGLDGYSTGGTLHIIANNQIGFTTDPDEGRSTRYSSDLAKGFDVPIIHVNADDPAAAISAIRLAMAYRDRFAKDVVVDLVGYRRFGHNEGDEPAYTQPKMYEIIDKHPTVRALYADSLVERGDITAEQADAMLDSVQARMRDAHEGLKHAISSGSVTPKESRPGAGSTTQIETAVSTAVLKELNEELLAVPAGFTVNTKLERQLERRREALAEGHGIDWGQAEGLAFASLLLEGIPIRLTGQDTERGTFSHRHLVFHDSDTGDQYAPIQHLRGSKAPFEVYNSPLSETGALGFEYGYSVARPRALVLWEAQFGDFVNAAQVIVDQFIVAGLAKWQQSSRLTLLLPHGYEGSGPEHSSARLERFLQLAAQENIRIANPSTAAQYFHLLRRQALQERPRPLVVTTPKGLLRLRQASSTSDDLSAGAFLQVIDDPALDDEARWSARRLILCSGKIYYDIVGSEAHSSAERVAVARLEQLYPFPVGAYDELISRYPNIEELVWAQEEPQNMGVWRALRHRFEDGLPAEVDLRYVGRPWRASPAEGYPTAHAVEQERIVREALGIWG